MLQGRFMSVKLSCSFLFFFSFSFAIDHLRRRNWLWALDAIYYQKVHLIGLKTANLPWRASLLRTKCHLQLLAPHWDRRAIDLKFYASTPFFWYSIHFFMISGFVWTNLPAIKKKIIALKSSVKNDCNWL